MIRDYVLKAKIYVYIEPDDENDIADCLFGKISEREYEFVDLESIVETKEDLEYPDLWKRILELLESEKSKSNEEEAIEKPKEKAERWDD